MSVVAVTVSVVAVVASAVVVAAAASVVVAGSVVVVAVVVPVVSVPVLSLTLSPLKNVYAQAYPQGDNCENSGIRRFRFGCASLGKRPGWK